MGEEDSDDEIDAQANIKDAASRDLDYDDSDEKNDDELMGGKQSMDNDLIDLSEGLEMGATNTKKAAQNIPKLSAP